MQTAGIPIKMLFEFSVKHSSDYYYSSNTECTENGIQYSDNAIFGLEIAKIKMQKMIIPLRNFFSREAHSISDAVIGQNFTQR